MPIPCFRPSSINQISGLSRTILNCVLESFFDKTSTEYAINIDRLLETIVGDLIRSFEKGQWKELVELCQKAVELYLPYELYLREASGRLEGPSFDEKIWEIAARHALIIDYNDYLDNNEEFVNDKNIVFQAVNWQSYPDRKSRMAFIAKLKKQLSSEEVRIYFEPMFDSLKEFEVFCKQNFVKIVLEIKDKYMDLFCRMNPVLGKSVVKNTKRKTNEVSYMKIKLVWI